jgi:hypothetical protein
MEWRLNVFGLSISVGGKVSRTPPPRMLAENSKQKMPERKGSHNSSWSFFRTAKLFAMSPQV